MTRIESSTETARRFFPVILQSPWAETHLSSLAAETNREWDHWYYVSTNGQLKDPVTGKKLIDIFGNPKDEIEEKELRIIHELNSWLEENSEGLAFWISPKADGKYPCHKLIIHRIAYTLTGEKAILNAAILFDGPLKNPELLRETLIVRPDNEEEIENIILWIEEREKQEVPREGKNYTFQSRVYLELALQGFSLQRIVEEMTRNGFIGPHPTSCLPIYKPQATFSNSIPYNPFIMAKINGEAKFVKRCGVCGKEINSFISKGYRCPSCGGVYEGC